MSAGPQDIDWDRLDKKKFFVVGVGLFSGVTTALFPLTVIKTRQMAAHKDVSAGMGGSKQIAQQIWRQEGIRGFYRGFGTVVFGTIPARTVYLTTLEVTKTAVTRLGEQMDVAPAMLAGAASFVGGGAASASTQLVVVPIDVVSQRLMMHGVNTSSASNSSSGSGVGVGRGSAAAAGTAAVQQPHAAVTAAAAATPGHQHSRGFHTTTSNIISSRFQAARQPHLQQPFLQQQQQQALPCHSSSSIQQCQHGWRLHQGPSFRPLGTAASAVVQPMNGFKMARLIVQEEGIKGLYRGFWPSLATFVPNSALWWGAYGFWQSFLWEQLPLGATPSGSISSSGSSSSSSISSGLGTGTVVAVQTTAAVLSGCTASLLTNPLDILKTRLQVAEPVNGKVPTWGHLLKELLAEEGPRGLLRGVAPRMASSAMWGTAMVSVYEFLKRLCAQPLA